jgi:hypothetical protein
MKREDGILQSLLDVYLRYSGRAAPCASPRPRPQEMRRRRPRRWHLPGDSRSSGAPQAPDGRSDACVPSRPGRRQHRHRRGPFLLDPVSIVLRGSSSRLLRAAIANPQLRRRVVQLDDRLSAGLARRVETSGASSRRRSGGACEAGGFLAAGLVRNGRSRVGFLRASPGELARCGDDPPARATRRPDRVVAGFPAGRLDVRRTVRRSLSAEAFPSIRRSVTARDKAGLYLL